MNKLLNLCRFSVDNQKGVIHVLPLLLIIAAVGVISFLLVSSTAPFSSGLFQKINSKTSSFAAVLGTPSPTPTSTPSPASGGGIGYAASYGIWNPNPQYDTCPSYPTSVTTQQQKIDYIKFVHDSYKVKGPDGKWYPTWHPAVDPATGCRFGHEHGRNPSQSLVWQQVKDYFAYTNPDGSKDLAEAGLPFGYANEQYDAWSQARGINSMRHEDHVGHKVDWANDETDLATGNHSTTKNTGVWITNEQTGADTGVRCFFLAKPHQGVSTKDAFTNNLHEVFYFADCRHPSQPELNTKISIAVLEGFGAPGGFTSFAPLCGLDRRGSPLDLVCPLGKDANGACLKDSVNQNYPTGDGDREIITRDCIEQGFLVPTNDENVFSGNLYEAWPASLEIIKPDGTNLLSGINLLFDVEDANRYYYPESLKQQRGYHNPDAPLNTGYTMDLCYDLSVPGRAYHGGPCSYATNFGQITDIKWNDPRSAFRGLHRGMYFQTGNIQNAGGPEFWYTDPFGKNASNTPFSGAIKQQITSKNMEYSFLIGQALDPRVNDRTHDDGGGSVHAPN